MNHSFRPPRLHRRLILASAAVVAAVAFAHAPASPAHAQSAFDRVLAAVDANQAAEVRSLLAQGIDVNTTDRDGKVIASGSAAVVQDDPLVGAEGDDELRQPVVLLLGGILTRAGLVGLGGPAQRKAVDEMLLIGCIM
jgi:hypothetical protein